MNTIWVRTAGLGIFILAIGSGCGGSSPTSPSTGGGGTAVSGATITIGSDGSVSPVQVTISVGQSVTFVNNDSRSHSMNSDPHPLHTDCPPLNAVSVIAPGQTRASDALTSARTCRYHDHNDPENAKLMGSVVIR